MQFPEKRKMNNEPQDSAYNPTDPFDDGAIKRARKLLHEIPDKIGGYRILERIGDGGMGEVWVAEQQQPVRRKVAIKLIKAGMDTRQVLARFDAERQALALMDHPNIAKVFDGGMTDSGRPYFVMEYVKGIPFTDYCDRARLSLEARLRLFIPVCSAVQHAHQKGIIHRDIKPSNILICLYDGTPVPKVIDFGLAKAMNHALTEQTIYTGHGVMVGTPLYMSPEQAESNNLDIDTRTDVYSLGVVLYELLTGTTPLERQQLQRAAFHEVLRLIKDVEPPRPSLRLSGSDSLPTIAAQRNIDPKKLRRSLTGELDWIVMKTLEKERSRRYETANGLARDIERFLNEEAVEACPPSTSYRMRKFVKKYRVKVAAVMAVVLTLVAGIIGTTWGLVRATIAERAATASEEKAVDSKKKAIEALQLVTQERDAKEMALQAESTQRHAAEHATTREIAQRMALETQLKEASRSDHAIAQDHLEQGRWPEALAYLGRSLRYDDTNVNARDSLWLALLLGKRDAPALPLRTFPVAYVVSGNGERVLASHPDGSQVCDAKSGTPVGPRLTAKPFNALLSNDGTTLVGESQDGEQRIWNTATGQLLGMPLAIKQRLNTCAFSPDGNTFVTVDADNSDIGIARIWNAATGCEIGNGLRHHDGVVLSCAYSVDGTKLVTTTAHSAFVWEASTGELLNKPISDRSYLWSAAFAPDGDRIVTTNLSNTSQMWTYTTGERWGGPMTSGPIPGGVLRAHISPDGARIATASADRTAKVWDVTSQTTVGNTMLHDNTVLDATFSRDGRILVTASLDGTAKLWNAFDGSPLSSSFRMASAVQGAIIADNLETVVTRSYTDVMTWSTCTNQPIGIPLPHKASIAVASFSPDGKRVVTGGADGTVQIWDSRSGDRLYPALEHFGSEVEAITFAPTGHRFAIVSKDHLVRVWDSSTGALIGRPLVHNGNVLSIAFRDSQLTLVTACSDGMLRIWDVSKGTLIGSPWEPAFLTNAGADLSFETRVQLSPNGTLIMVVKDEDPSFKIGNHTVAIWDIDSRRQLGREIKDQHQVYSAFFDNSGTRVVIAGDGFMQVWDPVTGEPLSPLFTPPPKASAIDGEFSPDGLLVTTRLNNSTAAIWNVHSGECVTSRLSHSGDVWSPQFSRDGRRVVTASTEGKTAFNVAFSESALARIWDTASGQRIGPPIRMKTQGQCGLKFSPDGTRLLATYHDGTARLWPAPPTTALKGPIAEKLTSFCAGVGLDPETGTLESKSVEKRLSMWPELESLLSTSPEWRWLAELSYPRLPSSFVSSEATLTMREAATRLFSTRNASAIREAQRADPGHPLTQIATNVEGAGKEASERYLHEYGTRRLLADMKLNSIAIELLARQHDFARSKLLLDKAAGRGQAGPELFAAIVCLAQELSISGDHAGSATLLRSHMEAMKSEMGGHSETVLSAMAWLAYNLDGPGQLEERVRAYRECMVLYQQAHGREHPSTLTIEFSLANSLLSINRREEAYMVARAIVPHSERLGAQFGPQVAYAFSVATQTSGHTAEAVPHLAGVLPVIQRHLSEDDPQRLLFESVYGEGLLRAGRHKDGLAIIDLVITRLRTIRESQRWLAVPITANLAWVLNECGYPEKGAAIDEELVTWSRTLSPPDGAVVAASLRFLGELLTILPDLDRAIRVLNEALEIQLRQESPDQSQVILAREAHASCLIARGDYALAEVNLREVLSWRNENAPDALAIYRTQSALGESLIGLKQYVEAERLLLSANEDLQRIADTIGPDLRRAFLKKARSRLVKLFEAWEKPEEAAKWRADIP